jgi:hypothetical protein
MTLQWHTHNDGYLYAQGRKGRYVISEGFGKQFGMVRLNIQGRIAYLTGFESAKDFAEEFDK